MAEDFSNQTSQPDTQAPSPLSTASPLDPSSASSDTSANSPVPGPLLPSAPDNRETMKNKKKALGVLMSGLVVIFLATAAFLYFLIFGQKISAQNVRSAQNIVNTLSSDVTSINQAISGRNANSLTAYTKQINDASSKLADADRQYASLQTSPTLKDSKTNQKFQALAVKWSPYITYAHKDLQDDQSIFIPTFEFLDQISKLSQKQLSNPSQLSSFLTKLKGLSDASSQQLSTVTAQLPENQDGLSAVKTFASQVSGDAHYSQQAFAAKNYPAVSQDIDQIQGQGTTLQTALSQAIRKSEADMQKVDPGVEINSLQSALDTLQTQV